jgi:hypothetical protein
VLGPVQIARGQPIAPASEHLWQARAMSQRQVPRLALLLAGLGAYKAARGSRLGSGISFLLDRFLLEQPAPVPERGAARHRRCCRSG